MSKDGGPALCRNCGDPLEMRGLWQARDGRCLPCKRAQQNAANLAKGDRLKTEAKASYKRRKPYYDAYWQSLRVDPVHVMKRKARRKVATEIEAGRLVRKACGKCGKTPADAHHKDYAFPLDVEWLCRSCHFAEERMAA